MPSEVCTPLSLNPQVMQALLQAQHDTPVLLSLFDRTDTLQWANLAFRQAFGLHDDEFPTWMDMMRQGHQQRVGSIVNARDFEVWLASAHSRRGKVAYRGMECDLHDGRWIWMTESLCADGSMLCVGTDITSLRSDSRDLRLERDLAQRAAMTDALTGISNRAHILALLEQQLPHVRMGNPCGLAVIDLDHFKKINDTYGHAGGDRVLQHFAHILRQELRREDGFGRIGGEEFLVVMPGIPAHSLAASLQRLIDLLRQQRPLAEYPDFFYTCSIGATQLQAGDCSASALQRADAALYQAKAQGRCRVVQA